LCTTAQPLDGVVEQLEREASPPVRGLLAGLAWCDERSQGKAYSGTCLML
jgi:hypothetical protein